MPNRINGNAKSKMWLEENGYGSREKGVRYTSTWKLISDKLGVQLNQHSRKEYPRIAGQCPTLADLVRIAEKKITLRLDRFSPRVERQTAPIVNAGDGLGDDFVEFLVKSQRPGYHLPPHKTVASNVARWIAKARSSGRGTICTFVCPDWTVGADGRYTFTSVGNGIGLVAKRALDALPNLWRFFEEHGVTLDIVVAIGDFEGLSPSTQERIEMRYSEFRQRCFESQQATHGAILERCPEMAGHLSTPLITTLAGGIGAWNTRLAEGASRIAQLGLARALSVSPSDIQHIVRARRSLYERWHGEGVDAHACLAAQLPEYGALGAIAASLENPLVLGCDHVVMGYGFRLLEPSTPVVYVRGSDY